ncbi:PAS domain S-box protein [Rubrivivax gelatinosus]|uniref:Virulence sensor protein BvgS n=2 Tax=Rubrivivax gelatinosus TaxID=28068 RepID=I0HY34_RUBGI|nr:PAS domain S-box protein [Rubrivivax gelatinosus]BAL97921.1 PAS/PAC sensor hybrid histidine kinase [Rubrivivax gelatinosus IL144]
MVTSLPDDHAPRPPQRGPAGDPGGRRLRTGAAGGDRALLAAALAAAAAAVAAIAAPIPIDTALRLPLAAALGLAALLAAAGAALVRRVQQEARASASGEREARTLLAMAADACWELDAEHRLVAIRRRHSDALSASEGLGQLPWELPQFGCDEETLDLLRADLDARSPFRDRLVHWLGAEGRPRSLLISGEPRRDARGAFVGFRGVARDVSAEMAARRALAAAETRYEELFARIPTPLVLHRRGRVLDANPAALALLGCETLETLVGHELLGAYEAGESRERERRRFDELEDAPVGAALAIADFRLQPRGGERLSVRAISVRIEAEGGPATLSIYADDTERLAAEQTLRRSEAVLTHLFASSPELITLTDLGTGRFTMVNDTFVRATGFAAADVVGRTAIELGLWRHDDQRRLFAEQMQRGGCATDLPAEFRARDGRVLAVLVSGTRFSVEGHDYLVVNARDVTDAERSRREREAILENASIGIAVTRGGRFMLANRRFEQMFGWPPGGLVERPAAVVWPGSDEIVEIARGTLPALARGEPFELEGHAQRRDGSSFVARLVVKAVDPVDPARGGAVWIVEDVTERREFERRLAAARDAAEAANRAKSAFLANTNHELRNPLNGMINLAKLARDAKLDEKLRQQYLDHIAESAQSLAAIVSDILDVSKIEAGRMELASEPFDLVELLRGAQRVYTTMAAARGLSLEFDIGPGLDGTVVGDPLRVRQIVTNFLGNALKFTAEGGVRVAARRVPGGRVRLEVHDSGPGIDPATQARLFRPFTQADESTTRRFGGTGLGLSICRELATLMGGEVGVDSQPGAGSVFWAVLPLPRSLAPAASTPAAVAAAAPASTAAAPRELAGARVLMAEDNPVNMMIAVALLERWGLDVEQAVDGRQAVEAVERAAASGRPFDAVLMDVQMPVMSGYEATRTLRYREAGRRLPIIALTAAALVSEREAAIAAGMDDFLTKPIDADKLRETLARWVRASA